MSTIKNIILSILFSFLAVFPAVAAYVENGGFGATWAAPIASLLTEMYLNREISKERKPLEDRILNGNLMDRVKVK